MTRRFGGGRARRTDEQGAVAILVALSLVALCVATALVLDFGVVRYEKQINKSGADSSVMAGVLALDTGDGDYHAWKGVCTALAYLRANDTRLSGLTGTYKNGNGAGIAGACSGSTVPQDTVCVAGNKSTWAWYSGTAYSGKISIDIKSGYVLPDPAFADDTALSGDNGDAAQGGCDQVAVIIAQTEKPGLGSLASNSDLITRVRSVARSSPNSSLDGAVALLLLERHSCSAITAGSTNTYFDVLGNGPVPGLIHADSLGNGTCQSSERVLYGKFAGHIKARHAVTGGLPGLITTAALSGLPGSVPSKASDGATNVCAEQPNGTCAAATGRGIIGRAPVDKRYLSGVKTAMQYAAGQTSLTTAAATAAGYHVYTPTNCANITGAPPAALNNKTKIFVNCPTGAKFGTFTFPSTATTVVFNSTNVEVPSTNFLSIPNAQRVFIKGASGGDGLLVKGTLNLNLGAPAAFDCSLRTTAPRNQLVIGNGNYTSTSQAVVNMCQTTVLMAAGYTGTTFGTCPPPAAITPPTVEPTDNTCSGSVSLGAQGSVGWTAPNLVSGPATAADWAALEDLALWTEASSQSSIGGGGVMKVSGVFFLPNANPFLLSGSGTQSNGANAQFVARRLEANGQGTLFMKPNLNDVVTIPLPATIGLVR